MEREKLIWKSSDLKIISLKELPNKVKIKLNSNDTNNR